MDVLSLFVSDEFFMKIHKSVSIKFHLSAGQQLSVYRKHNNREKLRREVCNLQRQQYGHGHVDD